MDMFASASPSLAEYLQWFESRLDSVKDSLMTEIEAVKNDVGTFSAMESLRNEKKKIATQIEKSKQNLVEHYDWFEMKKKTMLEDEHAREWKALESMIALHQRSKEVLDNKLREVDEKIANLRERRNVDSVGRIVSPKKSSMKVAPTAKNKLVKVGLAKRAQKKLNESVIMNEQKEMTTKQRKIQRQVYRNALVYSLLKC